MWGCLVAGRTWGLDAGWEGTEGDGVDPGAGFRLQLSGGAIPGAWNVAGGAGQNQFQLTFK